MRHWSAATLILYLALIEHANDDTLMAPFGGSPTRGFDGSSDERFYVIDGPIEFIFQKDAAGAVVGFKEYRNGSEFTGKKIE